MAYYGAEPGDARRATMTFLWVVFADAVLKFLARCAGCVDPLHLDVAEFARIYSVEAATCAAHPVFGTPLNLVLSPRDGTLLGLGAGLFTGAVGQVYALALLAATAIAAVLLMRWEWRAHGDPRIVGVLLGGAWVEGFPRVLGNGSGLAQLELMGIGINLADFALPAGALWLASRAFGEWRA